ncbi:hypothetical protein OE88DRAFT_1408181 [Heliocybe sulcata]|uniref:Uncharacterized protein n=1 Tax=Heliocybe sulcata TaxID=5364 RepID=A0A5C3N402_9AGAM|nr:hypothetical protein OE88DRAFT_1408181 [Heliocybe sulcata]
MPQSFPEHRRLTRERKARRYPYANLLGLVPSYIPIGFIPPLLDVVSEKCSWYIVPYVGQSFAEARLSGVYYGTYLISLFVPLPSRARSILRAQSCIRADGVRVKVLTLRLVTVFELS